MIKNLSDFPYVIKTARLMLRVIMPNMDNAEIIFNAIEQNREYLEAWQGDLEYLRNVSDVLERLKYRYSQISKNEGIMFGIYDENKFIGRIRFFNVKDNSCEIGFWLIESETGRGIMSEALSALEIELFKFGFDKIILDIDDGNIRSENLARRNGYVFDKRLPMASWAKCIGKCDSLIFVKNKTN